MKKKIAISLATVAVVAIWGTVLLLMGKPRQVYISFYIFSLIGLGFAVVGYLVVYLASRKNVKLPKKDH
ncbi:MAG: hypothetical protein H3C36_03410 [Chitinophagaceae bacterium]|nr:hypothetical protein [Chitinophagaceae bacterium]MCW5914970.1 hypothetical protein [Chitinophagaceae bacterium]MCZ2396761.1 hypothetical protein [Chitinophagales bacterium]